jgi:hypothetical protein
MRNKPTMVHAKPTAQNSAETAQARLSGLGSIESKGQGQGADFGASGAVCDRVNGTPTRRGGTGFRLSAVKAPREVCHGGTDSQNPAAAGLTPTERAAVQAAIESELYTVRKASRADWIHGRKIILRDCMALPFLDADARRRLGACPLPSKQERISELIELQQFLASK